MSEVSEDIGETLDFSAIEPTQRRLLGGFLQGVRRRLRLRSALWAGLLLGDVLLLLFLVGLTPHALAAGWLRGVYLGLGTAALMATAWVIARRGVFWPDDRAIAALVAKLDPTIGDSVLSAVELATEPLTRRSPSATLVELHLQSTAASLEAVSPRALVPLSPPWWLSRLGLVLVATLTVIAVFAPRALTRFFADLGRPPDTPAVFESGFRAVIGQIRLSYSYPAYTGLEPKVVEGAAGDVRGPRGTEVKIEALGDRELEAAWMRLESGATVAFTVGPDGRSLEANFALTESTVWRAELQNRAGEVANDPLAHAVIVDDDAFPEVKLIAPAEDLEIDELGAIELAWTARDDYGLHAANLIVGRGGTETRTALDIGVDPREKTATFAWENAERSPAPGSEITLAIEVFDTDTISGPKRSVSETRRLRVRSMTEVHSELLLNLERLLDEVVQSLGSGLTAVAAQPMNVREVADAESELGERMSAHVVAIDELLRGLWNDPLGSEQTYETVAEMRVRLETIAAESKSFVKREAPALRRAIGDPPLVAALIELRQREVAELETDSLLLDDLVHRERVEELKQLAAELVKDQERLTALLEDLQRSDDPRTRQEIARLMARMERNLAELETRMAEMSGGESSDEFLNLDRLRESMGKNTSEKLAEMREKLEAGEIDQAGEEARELMASLRGTLAALEQGVRRGDGPIGDSRLFEQANRIGERLGALVRAEGQLVEATDHVKRQIEARRFGRDGDPAKLLDRERDRAGKIAALAREARENLASDATVREQRRLIGELETAAAEGQKRLIEGAASEELDRRQRELFALRAELQAKGSTDPLVADDALGEAATNADKAAMALAGRALDEAIAAVEELSFLTREAARRLRSSSAGASVDSESSDQQSSVATSPISAERDQADQLSHEAADQSAELLKDLRALHSLTKRPLAADSSEIEDQSMSEFERRQRSLRKETDELLGMADDLKREVPEVPAELRERLEQAGDYMDLASRSLEVKDIAAGLHNEREAKARLEEAMQSAEQAAGACKGGGSSGGSKPGGGGLAFVPMGVGGQPRFKRAGENGEGEREGSGRGFRADKVVIPGADQARAPEEFRKDILDAMKEPRPLGYDDRIDAYYRRLVQ